MITVHIKKPLNIYDPSRTVSKKPPMSAWQLVHDNPNMERVHDRMFKACSAFLEGTTAATVQPEAFRTYVQHHCEPRILLAAVLDIRPSRMLDNPKTARLSLMINPAAGV